MEKYKIGPTLGDGTFGVVLKATQIQTGQQIAIKKMKQKCPKWQDCVNLPEISSLQKFHHPNIVNLYEIIKENSELYFILEYMDRNLYQLMKDRQKPFQEIQIRNIIYQTLQGLNYIHRHGYFHRDLKPENLLESQGTIKIADFGLAREIRSKPPFTDYVSTRWYRAPEIILRAPNYNSPIDIFAVGCIMAELYRLWPLFAGQCERDQINQICKVLGTPCKEDWPEGYKLAAKVGFVFPQFKAQNFQDLIPNASPEAIDLIQQMLRYAPQKRPSAQKALQHKYFMCNLPVQIDDFKVNIIENEDGSILIDKQNFIQNNNFEKDKENISQQNKNILGNNSIDNFIKDLLEESKIAPNESKIDQNMYERHKQLMKNTKYRPGYIFQCQ
ncbi:intestinal cell mak-like kinase, putative [Ichthyophthirius multifiliis]|uniref:Intestinal cell mak-like kinase, putative n=1 Tax=Ichthyophthirius multifiliis TaxID=5932 RepID=G0QNQ1_ICHMU|nr:intestinal cell mak-like kinase, putative [Ichthyophthirius multifiliis]EGR33152.1 intestinal cell mak-like kinase, putative [Ichthyophthirius multifiliis]|eukprot:XP_004037138.1 intestinal cell mak-like kinase, putative [Ichthyophthirius multifiliis]